MAVGVGTTATTVVEVGITSGIEVIGVGAGADVVGTVMAGAAGTVVAGAGAGTGRGRNRSTTDRTLAAWSSQSLPFGVSGSPNAVYISHPILRFQQLLGSKPIRGVDSRMNKSYGAMAARANANSG